MDNVFVYVVPLPNKVNEYVAPCSDGYTVYINENLDRPKQLEAYEHAVNHIKKNDFERYDVQIIESQFK